MFRPLSADLSPEPILAAVDAYHGAIHDLDRGLAVGSAALARGWRNLARRLDQLGLAAGDRVVLAVGNGPLFLAALAAILARDASPLLVHAETPPGELQRLAARCGAQFLVTDAHEPAALAAIAADVRAVQCSFWVDVLWARLTQASDVAFPAGDLALRGVPLHPTSGTTGYVKIAARPGACAIAEAAHYVQTLEIGARDLLLAVPPMSHAYAYGMCAMVPLLTGASLVTLRRFSPKAVLQALAEHRITLFPAVPAMLEVLLYGAGQRLRQSQTTVLSAGAPLADRTAEEFYRRAGRWVRPLYGTTETGGIAIGAAEVPASQGAVGPPMQGVDVQLEPSPAAAGLGEGAGRVHVRSASMMAGYLEAHGLEPPPPDGFFATGDLGRFAPGGVLHLVARETDVINVYGMKVVPGEVEEVIAALPGVVEVKVYAGQTRAGDALVKAAVAVRDGLPASAIREHCRAHLVYYKRPEVIHLVDRLPRTPAGKIRRDALP